MRASAYINLYENMLAGRAVTPAQLLAGIADGLPLEKEELDLSLLLDQLESIFWRFLSAAQRARQARLLETRLWNAMLEDSTRRSNERKLLFLGFCNISMDRSSQDTIFSIWKNEHPPAGIKLSEEEYTSLATGLALRQYPGWRQILQEQLGRIKNTDNKRRLEFLLPSLSDDPIERDRFFASLQKQQNRQKESWVLTALGYLHHPLRSGASEKYILPSLNLLEEVHSTGGVFFPQSWLQATLGYYTTPSAAVIVKQFLRDHPGYNARLRQKILQSSDNLFRAVKLNANQ
jgi:aminopeptidase N